MTLINMVQNQRYIMFGNQDNMTEVKPISSRIGEDMRITGTVISDGSVVCAASSKAQLNVTICIFYWGNIKW